MPVTDRASRTALLSALAALFACSDTPITTPVAPAQRSNELLASVASTTACLDIAVSDSSPQVGDIIALRAVDRTTIGRRTLQPTAVVWTSRAPAVLSVSGAVAAAQGVGATYVVALNGKCTDSIAVTIADRAAVPPPPLSPPTQPPTGGPAATHRIELAVTTFRQGADPIVSNGIPLPKGWLFARDLASASIVAGQTEIARNVRALSGLYSDGSLRAIQVQFHARDAGGGSVALALGVLRNLPEMPAITVSSDSPDAAALPTSPQYLISTGIVGPTVPSSESPNIQYELQFRSFSEKHYLQDGSNWETANYYDRAYNHFAFWARTGEVKYWIRAVDLALNYRKNYLEANAYGPSPHWSLLEGQQLHYWLTGDDKSRKAVIETARRMTTAYTPSLMASPASPYNEGRIQARVLMSSLLAWELGDSTDNWGAKSTAYVRGIIGLQQADGRWSWPNWCGRQSNYMVGLQNDALIKYYERFATDPTIVRSVQLAVDYIHRVSWYPSTKNIGYVDGTCPNIGDNQPTADLNMLIVTGYAFVGARTGNRTYIARADSIADGAIAGAWLDGSKQFNQQYYDSHQYLWYRR